MSFVQETFQTHSPGVSTICVCRPTLWTFAKSDGIFKTVIVTFCPDEYFISLPLAVGGTKWTSIIVFIICYRHVVLTNILMYSPGGSTMYVSTVRRLIGVSYITFLPENERHFKIVVIVFSAKYFKTIRQVPTQSTLLHRWTVIQQIFDEKK